MNSNSLSAWDHDKSDEDLPSLKSEKNSKIQPTPEESKSELISKKSKKSLTLPKQILGGKEIQINTTRSRGEISLLKYLFEKNGWKEVFKTNGDILWSGLAIPEEDLSIATEIMVNRIPGMPELAHKKTTGYFLNKFREYFPKEYDFFPRTFLYPEQEELFVKHFKKRAKKNKNNFYIAKPTSGCQGDGIFLITKLNDLPSNSYSRPPELVIQEYISNPLIIDKKKFDLRLFVLISNLKPFVAFVSDEGLARFATEEYTTITKDNLRDYFMHLTNYSLNKLNSKFIYSEELTEIHEGSKRSLTSLWKSLEKVGLDIELIKNRIYELITKFLRSMHPFLLFNYKSAFGGKDNGKCFHLIGFDILIDDELKPWLIEINNNPSLNINHEDEKEKEKNNKKNISKISPIDLFVKSKVVEDSILLISEEKEFVENLQPFQDYRNFKVIFNEKFDGLLEQDLFKIILEIYGKLSGYKFKSSITASRFIKLANLEGMTNEKITKSSYDLIFTKILRNNYDTKNMDFYSFLEAFEELTSKLDSNYSEKNKFPTVWRLANLIKRQIDIL